jgi:hypothetical protein
MCVIKYILTTCIFYVDDAHEMMTPNLSNDPAATQSVSKGTVRWVPNKPVRTGVGEA